MHTYDSLLHTETDIVTHGMHYVYVILLDVSCIMLNVLYVVKLSMYIEKLTIYKLQLTILYIYR